MLRIYVTPSFDVHYRFLCVVEETIIELRGNGVVMTIYEIDIKTLEFLQVKANKIGEYLSQLWFDPFFWHNPEMHQIKHGLKKVREYRGLMNDDISFMEIRRKGKKRKKYLVKELLGEGQLFPMVGIETLRYPDSINGKIMIRENVFGAGCLARFELLNEIGDLSKLETMIINNQNGFQRTLFFKRYRHEYISSSYDDFVLRKGALEILED
jgi:hypothetical protein